MPYITKRDRQDLEFYPKHNPENGGELNFCITTLISGFIYQQGLKYQNISDVLGALEGAKAEFIRRVVNPYEEEKKLDNGDIPAYDNLLNDLKVLADVRTS